MAKVFLRWYKLFRQTVLGKTAGDISTLRALSHWFIAIIRPILIIAIIAIIDIIFWLKRLLGLFKMVFPYRNESNSLIVDTENVHCIKHCHIDVKNNANSINCFCNGPEGGHHES